MTGRSITGRVESGRRQAAWFTRLEWVQAQCLEKLAFRPFPGTLNLRVDPAFSASAAKWRQTPGPALIPPDDGFCRAKILPARVAHIPAAVILPPESHNVHDDMVLEVLAPLSLKEALGLADGDRLTVTLDETDGRAYNGGD
jgi:CTP-dependent riboflavin kinase